VTGCWEGEKAFSRKGGKEGNAGGNCGVVAERRGVEQNADMKKTPKGDQLSLREIRTQKRAFTNVNQSQTRENGSENAIRTRWRLWVVVLLP